MRDIICTKPAGMKNAKNATEGLGTKAEQQSTWTIKGEEEDELMNQEENEQLEEDEDEEQEELIEQKKKRSSLKNRRS